MTGTAEGGLAAGGTADGGTPGKLAIDVWSDVMCPFCYLGDAHLALALEQFPHRDSVTVRYHSFLLMPELTADTAMSPIDLLVTKRGVSRDQAVAMNAQIAERGRAVGLDYQMERAIATSTRAAHRLAHFAAVHGRQHELVQRLFRAYFSDGLNLSAPQVLADLADEVGLDRGEALAALESGAFADAVEADLEQARQLGISGVPFFVFDGRYAVSGAQPVPVFLQALETTWSELPAQSAGAPR